MRGSVKRGMSSNFAEIRGNMNILLTTSAAPEKSPFSTDEKRPPLGLGFLISLLRQQGHQVWFLDNYLAPTGFLEQGFLQRHHIDLVGIYANTICYRDTLRMLSAIEALRQRGVWLGKIAVGGPHAVVALETIPEYVDYVVQGEGERAVLAIVEGTAQERLIREERIRDLDSLPFQPWDVFARLPYDDSCPWVDIRPVFTMNTSRGCPFQCAFCSVKSVWGANYTYMNAERILAEIEYLIKDYGAQGIYFREDHFTLREQRTVEFCEQLLHKPWQIQWACETRVDALSEDLIALMSKSGCKAVYLGIESGSQRVLDRLQKHISVEQIVKAIQWCKHYDIRTYCSLIIGTPGETFEDYLKTQQLMERLQPYRWTYNVFVGIPNSPLYQDIVNTHAYEYLDDLGLAYLPGFHVKCRFFYGMESQSLVEYRFRQQTDFDRHLQWLMYKNLIRTHIPRPIKQGLKKILRYA